MPKNPPLSFAQVDELIACDPESGKLTWKIHISRAHKAGEEAGSSKTLRLNRHGTPYNYSYVTIRGFQTPSARVVWLLCKGEWPRGNVLFADGDATNLAVSNLRLRDESLYAEPSPPLNSSFQANHRLSKEAARKYGRKRYYDLSQEEYDVILEAQGGVCAICEDVAVDKSGKSVQLHVDHDHKSGEVRGLLCGMCNAMLGYARDDEWRLCNAMEYLDPNRRWGRVMNARLRSELRRGGTLSGTAPSAVILPFKEGA